MKREHHSASREACDQDILRTRPVASREIKTTIGQGRESWNKEKNRKEECEGKGLAGRDLALRQVPERDRSGAVRLFETRGSQKEHRRPFESLIVTKLEWRESGEVKKKCSEWKSKLKFQLSGPPSSCGFSRAVPSQSTPPSELLQVQRRLFRVKRSTDRKLVSTRSCRSMLRCKMTGG